MVTESNALGESRKGSVSTDAKRSSLPFSQYIGDLTWWKLHYESEVHKPVAVERECTGPAAAARRPAAACWSRRGSLAGSTSACGYLKQSKPYVSVRTRMELPHRSGVRLE